MANTTTPNYLLWTTIGITTWLLIGRTWYTLRRLMFKITGITLNTTGPATLAITPHIAIKNPTPYQLIIRQVRLDIYFNNTYIATIAQPIHRRINPRAITTITPQVLIQNTPTWTAILDQLNTGNIDNWLLTLHGRATIDNITAPIHTTILGSDIIDTITHETR